ncbi:carbon-nitrogen hydrolase [Pholiota conissans]|uniref:Carbon-nitrogen hydrolase n=1 Tax=Pholiota conissans TaxID=109636 RepID=A0A9P5ZFL2_9AGAR|nr:carbon-nitrogen hydrolase [Pholiota conissans]
MNLRVGVVQFNPKIGQVQANLDRARELCRKIEPQSLDLLCFPEMAFTGYVFENASAISPYLEHPRTGPTSQFCSELAKTLGCYVIAGYPEKLSEDELAEIERASMGQTPRIHKGTEVRQVGANSAAFYNPDGAWVGGYRKSHLFDTDITWAKAGTGFTTFDLPSPLRRLSLGICMDLNPQTPDWTSASGPYEIADYCIAQKSNVLLLLNAWLDSNEEPEDEEDWHTLNYWAARTRPLWAENPKDDPSNGHETIVIVSNRTGDENGKKFAGSSAILSLTKGSGRPKLLDSMDRTEESIRIWHIQPHN